MGAYSSGGMVLTRPKPSEPSAACARRSSSRRPSRQTEPMSKLTHSASKLALKTDELQHESALSAPKAPSAQDEGHIKGSDMYGPRSVHGNNVHGCWAAPWALRAVRASAQHLGGRVGRRAVAGHRGGDPGIVEPVLRVSATFFRSML